MSEIFNLKTNADWVLLSACNTAAGDGRGADAVSGLGQAFFYAGTKSLLVSNWPVHSAATRDLMTGIFSARKADTQISKAEALRRASLSLIDGPGYLTEDGKPLFSYAHPIFWAPFTLVGDSL